MAECGAAPRFLTIFRIRIYFQAEPDSSRGQYFITIKLIFKYDEIIFILLKEKESGFSFFVGSRVWIYQRGLAKQFLMNKGKLPIGAKQVTNKDIYPRQTNIQPEWQTGRKKTGSLQYEAKAIL